MSAEPGLAVLLVGARREAGVGAELAPGPLPHVAEHLAQALRRVAERVRPDLAGLVGDEVELRVRARRGRLAPGVARAAGGELPLRLARESPAGPTAPGLGLVRVDEVDGQVRLERDPAVVAAPRPGAVRFA